MNARARRQATAPRGAYEEPEERDIWHPLGNVDRWQEDWIEGTEAATNEERKQQPNVSRAAQQGRRKKERKESITAAAAAATAAPDHGARTKRQRLDDLHRFIQQNRNPNTTAAYASAWRQFAKWLEEVENAARDPTERTEVDRPQEQEVAAYMQYLVEVKRSPMATVATALAGIADRLRYEISDDYHPCKGKLVDAMRGVLTPLAPPSQQKREMSWTLLARLATLTLTTSGADTGIAAAAAAAATGPMSHVAKRDGSMFLLAYHGYLRASEVARMNRGDITFSTEVGPTRIMKIHVNRMAKNDKERKGHERLVAEKPPEVRICVVRWMNSYLEGTRTTQSTPLSPLFTTEQGARMSKDTPNGRLRVWLQSLNDEDVDASEYGFHSLRAGAATESARAGVHERQIKQHGNWKSDAVRLYIRPSTEDRLAASNALGEREE